VIRRARQVRSLVVRVRGRGGRWSEDRTRKFPKLASGPTFSGAALPGSDPQDPKKVVRTPGFPDSRPWTPGFPDPGVRTPGNGGFPRRWTRFPPEPRFPGSWGGSRKVESCPMTPGLFQKTTDYNLCHPHGICAFLGRKPTFSGITDQSWTKTQLPTHCSKVPFWPFFKCWAPCLSGLCKAAWNSQETA
jgi:hypothetical protein